MFGGFFSALEPLAFLGMAMYAYMAMRRSGLAHPNRLALHWTIGSAIFSALGAGILGLAHTWPSVNKWTHGTMITAMHAHMAFFGAYVMVVLAMITYAAPGLFGHDQEAGESPTGSGLLVQGGMFGMTMAFAAAVSVRPTGADLGLGYLETPHQDSVHFLMVLGTGLLLPSGGLYSTISSSLREARTAPAVCRPLPGGDLTGERQRTGPCSRLADGLRHPGGQEPFTPGRRRDPRVSRNAQAGLGSCSKARPGR